MKVNSKYICILIDPCADVDCSDNPGEECVNTGGTGVCRCGDHATGYCSDKDSGDYCDSVNSRCLCGEGGEQCQEADQACRNSTCVGKTLTSSNSFVIACLLDLNPILLL